MKILITTTFIFFSSFVFSQDFQVNAPKSNSNSDLIITEEAPQTQGLLQMADELPKVGTYQIIFENNTPKRELEKETLFLVNKKRKAEEVEYLIVDKNTKIKILPYSIIYANDFVPVATYITE